MALYTQGTSTGSPYVLLPFVLCWHKHDNAWTPYGLKAGMGGVPVCDVTSTPRPSAYRRDGQGYVSVKMRPEQHRNAPGSVSPAPSQTPGVMSFFCQMLVEYIGIQDSYVKEVEERLFVPFAALP